MQSEERFAAPLSKTFLRLSGATGLDLLASADVTHTSPAVEKCSLNTPQARQASKPYPAYHVCSVARPSHCRQLWRYVAGSQSLALPLKECWCSWQESPSRLATSSACSQQPPHAESSIVAATCKHSGLEGMLQPTLPQIGCVCIIS